MKNVNKANLHNIITINLLFKCFDSQILAMTFSGGEEPTMLCTSHENRNALGGREQKKDNSERLWKNKE